MFILSCVLGMKENIAIIGSGISGLSMAYFLKDKYDVTLYEKNDYCGGHSRTKMIQGPEGEVPVDTGFIVFNYETYPNLIKLFERLNVPIQKSEMSFGVSIRNGELEYASQSLKTLFAQPKNLFSPSFWGMIRDILKFNRISKRRLKSNDLNPQMSLEKYLDEIGVKESFKINYLLPMGAAIWSTPMKGMYDFPAATFIRFFNNHGLLTTSCPVQWYTVRGGSQVYVQKLVEVLRSAGVKTSPRAKSVERLLGSVSITDELGEVKVYDKAIFASHSNESLSMLTKPSDKEIELLGAIQYQQNEMYLHGDESFMPKSKKAWASWIYLNEKVRDDKDQISLSYWMNSLQDLPSKSNYFVTLNPSHPPKSSQVHDYHVFHHPVFDHAAIEAQPEIQKIQGIRNTYYCGAYLRNGFHEDGIWSALQVAKHLGIECPW
jgi:predicted NAD/FAD-binding protein